jgi:uncharacterized membrane protein
LPYKVQWHKPGRNVVNLLSGNLVANDMLSIQNIILFCTILFSGLVAGLLYGYSCSVNPALKTLPDKEYISAMQLINRAIQNPVFFISFVGLLILLPWSSWLSYKNANAIPFVYMLIATIIYFVGVFGVTAVGNIPLNNQLEKFNLSSADATQMADMRLRFEAAWVRWHTIRTIASVVSFGILVWGLLKNLTYK